MIIEFTKMEGCGNDYVYIDGTRVHIPSDRKSELVRALSDRHFGIGGDGVIFINASSIADFEMEMYNADGSRGEMCGNGIRCVGKYVYDHKMTDRTEITVESFGKIKYLTLYPENGSVKRVRVNMGPAILEAAEVPVRCSIEEGRALQLPDGSHIACAAVELPIEVGDKTCRVTCVSMGNPHAVLFVDRTDDLPLTEIGPLFENNTRFPNRINTGCCAIGVAGVLCDRTDSRILVDVLGGQLEIEWDRENNTVWMTGPATTVFEGHVAIDC